MQMHVVLCQLVMCAILATGAGCLFLFRSIDRASPLANENAPVVARTRACVVFDGALRALSDSAEGVSCSALSWS